MGNFISYKKITTIVIVFVVALSAAAQVKIVAHRGFWKSEMAGMSENSLASLHAAQYHGFWGSEFDVHMTSDGVIVVNHDNDIEGVRIDANPYEAIKDKRLPNGEHHPLLEDYLLQGTLDGTVLVLEFKSHPAKEMEDELVEKSVAMLKEYGMYSPEKVLFISFSLYICEKIAAVAPEFTNQYLGGDLSPAELHEKGINGLDYNQNVLRKHPEWVKEAHDLGMSVNVWTVNDYADMQYFASLGVDAVTTNEPLLARLAISE